MRPKADVTQQKAGEDINAASNATPPDLREGLQAYLSSSFARSSQHSNTFCVFLFWHIDNVGHAYFDTLPLRLPTRVAESKHARPHACPPSSVAARCSWAGVCADDAGAGAVAGRRERGRSPVWGTLGLRQPLGGTSEHAGSGGMVEIAAAFAARRRTAALRGRGRDGRAAGSEQGVVIGNESTGRR